MSILSELIEKKITFQQAATQVENWITSLANKDPVIGAAAAALESDAKQAASNALAIGDTAAATYLGPLSKAAEAALDAALMSATKGAALPFTPMINAGIDQITAAAEAEIAAWSLKAKAQLATPPAAAPAA